MSLTAAAIRLMAAKGFSAGDIADIAEAMEAPVPALTPGAIRTRKWREKKEAECHRDVTVTGLGDVSREGDPTQVEIITSSLRSEDKPPTHPSGASPTKPKPSRSRLAPDGWRPSEKVLTDLDVQGFTPGEIERELANFRDHEFRDPKSDFDRTFRKWMRTSRNFQPGQSHERPHHDAKFDARQANLARHDAGADLAARHHRQS